MKSEGERVRTVHVHAVGIVPIHNRWKNDRISFNRLYTNQPSPLTNLNLGCHGNTIEWVYVGLTAGAAEEELCQRRLLVLWETEEELLEVLVGEVEDLDAGSSDD